MRIGIDARELCGSATGAGRYLGGLLAHWLVNPRHEFLLYAPEEVPLEADRSYELRIVEGRPGTWWEQLRLPRAARRDRLDVFFSPAYSAPLRLGVPFVVAIHDLSFVAHPQWFRWRERLRRRALARRSAHAARAVITISDFSRRELVEHLGIGGQRIHVIPPGVAAPNTKSQIPNPESRVLFVGTILNRRHVPDLIRAVARVVRTRPDVSLDIVGDDRSYPREDLTATIAAEGLEGRVRRHAYVADAALHEHYAQARAFAFLSEYEGLGLTPLEAIAAGVPAVLFDTPVARESCGGAALYAPIGDIDAAASALERALFDEPTRARLLAAAPAVLARYDWPRAARETLAVIEKAAVRI